MARSKSTSKQPGTKKKTRQGNSKFTKNGRKGGGVAGSSTSKTYKKLSKGQG